MSKTRILFLPLSNVLGHLTRTFSLAEKLLEYNIDVHIACDMYYSNLLQVLPEGISIHTTIEMPPSSSRSFGAIKAFGNTKEDDLLNLENANNLSSEALTVRSEYLKKMMTHDEKLIERLQPDMIVTDYRFTVTMLSKTPIHRVFHISNILGFLSFYHRIRGTFFSPLDTGNILVPGIPEIEFTNDKTTLENPNINWCGHFSWQGWKRLYKDAIALSEVAIFLCFGSTGNGPNLVPWLVENIDKNHSLLMVSDSDYQIQPQENLHAVKFGYLEECLKKSKIVCCHGGHGTVMECILHETPMLIFPNNLEQLEIGKHIEKLGLGILMNKPQASITTAYLNDTIEGLLSNTTIKKRLAQYAKILKQYNGLDKAASILLAALENN
ncbi:glycosyltransferase [uncultured Kordia sp.]|uniref:glycosyltransferase n=1 Tax=uncultured Kordia sp. TaxID=507699 RepID=UPI002623D31D|nr:glycosyltransferase [uncultured Kordia sp.]